MCLHLCLSVWFALSVSVNSARTEVPVVVDVMFVFAFLQTQYVKADTHYYLRTAPHCLFRMRVFAQMAKNDRTNKEKAAEFRRYF